MYLNLGISVRGVDKTLQGYWYDKRLIDETSCTGNTALSVCACVCLGLNMNCELIC